MCVKSYAVVKMIPFNVLMNGFKDFVKNLVGKLYLIIKICKVYSYPDPGETGHANPEISRSFGYLGYRLGGSNLIL